MNQARGTTLFSMDWHLKRERLQNKKSDMLQKIVQPSTLGLTEIRNLKHFLGLQSTGVENKVDS